MANNTRRKRLDQSAGNTLAEIDDTLAWLVESMQDNYVKQGEFTAEMAHAKLKQAGVQCTLDSLRSRLIRLGKIGALTKRSILIKGRLTNVYCRVHGVSVDF